PQLTESSGQIIQHAGLLRDHRGLLLQHAGLLRDHRVPGGARRATRPRRRQNGHNPPSSSPALSNQHDTLSRIQEDRIAASSARSVTEQPPNQRRGRECLRLYIVNSNVSRSQLSQNLTDRTLYERRICPVNSRSIEKNHSASHVGERAFTT